MAARTFGAAPNKAVPANPRYSGARTKLDTGPNMRKVLDSAQGPTHAHKKPKDEFFVRLKAHTLGRLLEPLVESQESIYALAHAANDDARSVATSVVPDSAGPSSAEGNVLILDLRPFEEFEQCHVYGARHFDPSQIQRSTNNMPRDVFFFKGPVECDKMIVLYDEDGKAARQFGNTFVERGIENTYVVSGGFLALCATAPHILVGHPPSNETLLTLMQRAGMKPPSARSEAGGAGGGMSARCSTAGSVRTQNTMLSSVAGSPGRMKAWK